MTWTMELKILCGKTYYETIVFGIVQAKYRRTFNSNTFPNRIFKLVKNFTIYGIYEAR